MSTNQNVTPLPTGGAWDKIADSQRAMYLVRRRMDAYEIARLSELTGLSKACLYAIRNGKTRWPRPHSIFTLLSVLGMEMYIKEVYGYGKI